jgi:hypothetical protein
MKSFSISISPKWTLAALVLVLFCASLQAQERGNVAKDQFSLATVCGDYGAIATYGANVARALGFEVMDGHGGITGAATVNQPGPSDTTRSISKIGISGTYNVDATGAGTMNLVIALPGGGSANVVEDFVITKTKVINGVLIATEIQDMQRVPSAVIDDSSLVIHTYTLRRVLKSCVSGH